MKKLITLFLVTAFLFTACDSKTGKKTTEKLQTPEGIAKDSIHINTNKAISNAATSLLATLPVRHFPITDSTNFDNFEKYGMPDKGFLNRIKFKPEHTDARNFRLNYKIPFSEKFTAAVVTYQSGDHELFTLLITLSPKNKIIDRLEIAYDEVAESAFRKTSKIEKDKIVVTSSNWMNEEPIFETETYILQSNGKFKIVQAGTNKQTNK